MTISSLNPDRILVALSRHPNPINPLLLIFPLFGPCIMGDLSTPTLKGVLTKGTTPFRPSRPSFVEGGDSGRRLDFPGRGPGWGEDLLNHPFGDMAIWREKGGDMTVD